MITKLETDTLSSTAGGMSLSGSNRGMTRLATSNDVAIPPTRAIAARTVPSSIDAANDTRCGIPI